jgi:hypothetical protein
MNQFDAILRNATEAIGPQYFCLPIANSRPVYRERVYCYELYHQLRSRWPVDLQYSLGGEVDKAGHPLIRGNGLDRLKPDLLVHEPGDMGGNYAVIEIKPLLHSTTLGIQKDLITLTAFRKYAGYARALFLLYGTGRFDSLQQIVRHLRNQPDGRIDLAAIEFWHHTAVGCAVEPFNIKKLIG